MLNQQFEAKCDGLLFVGRAFDHTRGYFVSKVTGLLGGGSADNPGGARSSGFGRFDVPNTFEDPRVITLQGFAYASTLWEVGNMVRQLDGMLGGQERIDDFVWSEFGEEFRVPVRRGRGTLSERRGATGRVNFTVKLRAADQLYFGAEHWVSGAGSVVVSQRGNFPACPWVFVEGPRTAPYTVSSAGKQFTVSQSLLAGQAHRIDMETGELFLNNTAQVGAVSRAEVFTIAPNVKQTVSISSGSLEVSVLDTYI